VPCDFTIRTDIGAVVTRFWATVTDDEFIELYRALLASTRYRPGLTEFADLRSVDRFSVSATALRLADWMLRQRLGSENSTRTLIISPADQRFGLARMYLSFVEPGPEDVEVFETLEEAAESAGLSVRLLERVLANPMGYDSPPSHARPMNEAAH
jgi:hypothetical protein